MLYTVTEYTMHPWTTRPMRLMPLLHKADIVMPNRRHWTQAPNKCYIYVLDTATATKPSQKSTCPGGGIGRRTSFRY